MKVTLRSEAQAPNPSSIDKQQCSVILLGIATGSRWGGDGQVGMRWLDSPYGELKFAPPKAYFIDLRQIRANLLQILTKIINIHKMHVQNIQGCHFLRKKSPCGTLHNIAKGLVPLFAVNHSTICRYLPLSAAICRYLPLFAVSISTICRYLPLAIPLFAAICR